MKIGEILGTRVDPRGEIEFDEAERDRYVSQFLAAFYADVEEEKRAELVYAVHLQVRNKHDLYIAVSDKLGSTLRKALHGYVSELWKSS
jgi:truncated hemoglobin YjbI